MMSELFKLNVTLRGPERSYESSYGPRTERDILAQLDVPVSGARAWAIYQEALRGTLKPDYIVKFPDGVSAEEAEEIRSRWKDIPARLIADVCLTNGEDGEDA